MLAVTAGCGGDESTLTIYLKQRLGSDGPPGQITPVLTPVERERRSGVSSACQAGLFVRQGPAPGEWGQGFLETLRPGTRLRAVSVERSVATVRLAGKEPDLYGSAAIFYSLTSLPGIDGVRILLDGAPCCVYSHAGRPIETLTEDTFAGWQGEPCELRVQTDAVRCRAGARRTLRP